MLRVVLALGVLFVAVDSQDSFRSPVVFDSTTHLLRGNRDLFEDDFGRDESRIVGGSQASIDEFPWFVEVLPVVDQGFCGGSLIHENIVLTARHCVSEDPQSSDAFRPGSKVMIGGTNVETPNGEIRYVKKVVPHPSPLWYDFAIVVLNVRSFKPTIALNSKRNNPTPGEQLVVTGHGYTFDNEQKQNQFLKKAYLTFVSDADCAKTASEENKEFDTDGMICASAENQATCQGDSGGPLVDLVTGEQVGIDSFGIHANCDQPYKYTSFVRVSFALPWIKQQICLHGTNKPAYCGGTANTADVTACLRIVKRKCNCALFFRGSNCYWNKAKTLCKYNPATSSYTPFRRFLKAVKNRYRRYCLNRNK